ncbi:MAG: CopG family antitoxin [Candidatus Brocadiales bacterium]
MQSEGSMRGNKTFISKSGSYQKIGEFWDTYDLADCWDKTKPAEFEVDIQSEITYYAVEKELAEKLQTLAKRRGIPANTLLNLWVQEKLKDRKI